MVGGGGDVTEVFFGEQPPDRGDRSSEVIIFITTNVQLSQMFLTSYLICGENVLSQQEGFW
jgi:hypothetical protein